MNGGDGIQQTLFSTDELIDELDSEILNDLPLPRKIIAPFRWAGGKGMLVSWLLQFLPPYHEVEIYVEPFAGAANLFWQLPRPFPKEVLNDIDERIVTLFRVLQDKEKFAEFLHRLLWTPYSIAEFERALETLESWDGHDEVTKAWAFFVATNQGFGRRVGENLGDWARSLDERRNQAGSWLTRKALLKSWHKRLERVHLDRRDGLKVIQDWDSEMTFFYVDPPYVMELRSRKLYADEPDIDYHRRLVEVLLSVKGKVMLSGYWHEVYEPLERAGWQRFEKRTVSHLAGRIRGSSIRGEGAAHRLVERVECVWLNYNPPSRHQQ